MRIFRFTILFFLFFQHAAAEVSEINLVCKYKNSWIVLTDGMGLDVKPPFGLEKHSYVSEVVQDIKDISLNLRWVETATAGLLTHNNVEDVVFQLEGNKIFYTLFQNINNKPFIIHEFSLDRLSGELQTRTRLNMEDNKERCKQFLTCDSEMSPETGGKMYSCSRAKALF